MLSTQVTSPDAWPPVSLDAFEKEHGVVLNAMHAITHVRECADKHDIRAAGIGTIEGEGVERTNAIMNTLASRLAAASLEGGKKMVCELIDALDEVKFSRLPQLYGRWRNKSMVGIRDSAWELVQLLRRVPAVPADLNVLQGIQLAERSAWVRLKDGALQMLGHHAAVEWVQLSSTQDDLNIIEQAHTDRLSRLTTSDRPPWECCAATRTHSLNLQFL